MTERQRMINEITYQLQSKEVTQHHDPVQLSQTDASKILELLKEQEQRIKNEYKRGYDCGYDRAWDEIGR